MAWRNVARRGMDKAVENAKLDKVPGKRRPSLHDLRHTFASLLVAQGLDVVFVSKQLRHKRTSVTLDVHADQFNRAESEDRARSAVEAAAETSWKPTVATGGERLLAVACEKRRFRWWCQTVATPAEGHPRQQGSAVRARHRPCGLDPRLTAPLAPASAPAALALARAPRGRGRERRPGGGAPAARAGPVQRRAAPERRAAPRGVGAYACRRGR
jgi:hypothetical protein